MANFIGSKCIVCDKLFEKDDDIVVCPECGTPYHRNCYLEKGNCINTELHEKNETWKAEDSPHIQNGEIICTNCGIHNSSLSMFCEKCGLPLIHLDESQQNKSYQNINGNGPLNFEATRINYDDPMCGFNPQEEYEDGTAKLSEVAAAVGDNTHYYLPIFKRFKETGKKFFPNFIAFLFPEFYYAYRKMYLPMILMLILKAINFFANVIYITTSGDFKMFTSQRLTNVFQNYQTLITSVGNVFYLIQLFFTVISGIFANFAYYKHIISLVKSTKEINGNQNNEVINKTLNKKGGTSYAMLIIVAVLEILVYFISAFFIMGITNK